MMKAMRKSAVHLAVAASVMGLGSTVGVVDSQAATFSQGNVGQALVFPYYTVNGNWQTNFNVMNVTNQTLAVKVRFHERKNSRDVLDFNIVLSPYDAWTGWVQDSTQGTQLFTTDESCTSPLVVNGVHAQQAAYIREFDDTGGQGLNRLREGYVEVLLMGVAQTIETPPDQDASTPGLQFDADAALANGENMYVPYFAKHVDGVPRDCTIVDKAFIATADPWVAPNDPLDPKYTGNLESESLPGSGDPPARINFTGPEEGVNYLKGNVTWLQKTTGAGAGSQALALADYSDQNWVTAQQFPWFLEPTFATDPGSTLWTITGADEFEEGFSFQNVLNEWANNPTTGAQTDWVITFPTKGYHVDAFNDQIQAASSKYRNGMDDVVTCSQAADPSQPADSAANRGTCTDARGDAPKVAPFEYLFGVEQAANDVTNDGDSTITVTYNVYDREEGSTVITSSGTSISPAPPPNVEVQTLRYEANVLQLGDVSVLDANTPALVDLSGLASGAPNGWARVQFTQELPVFGFAVKARSSGEPTSNYGQAMDHGYDNYVPPSDGG